MDNEADSDPLRQAIKELGVAKVARAAGVPPTTLYSYVRGDNQNLRSDIREKVVRAVAQMTGLAFEDDNLEMVLYAWPELTVEQRKLVFDLVNSLRKAGNEKNT